MSKPKTYPPYKVEGKGTDAWIVDSQGNDVVTWFAMGMHYDETLGDTIMQTLCDALNRKEEGK
jgi:hypothetical protein